MFKTLYISLLMATGISASAIETQPMDLKPNGKQEIVTKLMAEMITTTNYKRVVLNDSISRLIFNRYIESLDPNKSYFLASDVTALKKFENLFDEDLKNGNLDHAFIMFNLYRKRASECLAYSLAELGQKTDYSRGETFLQSRQNLPYFQNTNSMNEFWRKKTKYDQLVLKLAGNDDAKSRSLLIKRYQNQTITVNKLSSEDAFQLFMNAVSNSVDPHTAYYTPFNASQFNVGMSRTLEGIGATLALENDMVMVKAVVAGGPAFKSGNIRAGDRITAVAEGNGGVFQDIVGWRLDDAISLIRGPKGSVVRLEVLAKGKSASDRRETVEVTRAKIVLEDQSAKKDIRSYLVNGQPAKIGFITIPQFYMDANARNAGDQNYKSTTRDVKLLIDSLKQENVQGIIVDLRQNGGGSLAEAVDLTGLFINKGPVVQVKDVKGRIRPETDENPLVAYSGPLGVLVDRSSASASEIFSAAIQDYGRGIIIGSQTYGKGTVQTQVDLDRMIAGSVYREQALKLVADENGGMIPSGKRFFGQMNITIGKFYRINGSSTQHQGVTPDIAFPSLIPLSEYGEDSEPSALPWDTISRTNFVSGQKIESDLKRVNDLHQKRFDKSGISAYLKSVEGLTSNKQSTAAVPLNSQALKKQNDAKQVRNLAQLNVLRKEMGLPLLLKENSDEKSADLDFIKREAGQVLSDYILLAKQDNKTK